MMAKGREEKQYVIIRKECFFVRGHAGSNSMECELSIVAR